MIEILAVVIILSVSASLALVKYGDYMRRIRSQEGRQILTALYGGQVQYRREVGLGLNFLNGNLAAINANLNVTFPATFRNFNTLTAVNGPVFCGFPTVGRIVANDNSYALHITTQGTIICTTVANGCVSAICNRIN